MDSIRQHILPRFLLKGFASRFQRGEIFTWIYRRGGKIVETNIKKVGVEKYFYGKEGELSADAKITDLEQEYARLLDELRMREGQAEARWQDKKVSVFGILWRIRILRSEISTRRLVKDSDLSRRGLGEHFKRNKWTA